MDILEEIEFAAYKFLGAPRLRRKLEICFGERPRLKCWNDQTAYIEVEARCQQEPIRYAFQVAHEVVHTLDPVPLGDASVLEEGVATYFQHAYVINHVAITSKERATWNIPQEGDYKRAWQLILPIFNEDYFALRRLREAGGTLSNVAQQQLLELVPSLPAANACELVQRFEKWRQAT